MKTWLINKVRKVVHCQNLYFGKVGRVTCTGKLEKYRGLGEGDRKRSIRNLGKGWGEKKEGRVRKK